MGVYLLIGSLPRMIGPFLLVHLLETPTAIYDAHFKYVYSGPVPRTWLVYGSFVVLNLLAFVIVLGCREHLGPYKSPRDGDAPECIELIADVNDGQTKY